MIGEARDFLAPRTCISIVRKQKEVRLSALKVASLNANGCFDEGHVMVKD